MKQFSKDFKKLFLLQFTKELILHSRQGELLQLQDLIKEEITENKKDLIRSIKTQTSKTKKELQEEDLDFSESFNRVKPKIYSRPQTPTIPEIRLPPHLQYLRPVPRNIEMDLEKLNGLVKDPAVKIIECNGPDEHIIVRGSMGVKPTNIVLGKEEIDKIIETFSQVAHIPTHEGVYRVVAGRLILSSIISDVVGSKFIIKKMLYAPTFQGQVYPN